MKNRREQGTIYVSFTSKRNVCKTVILNIYLRYKYPSLQFSGIKTALLNNGYSVCLRNEYNNLTAVHNQFPNYKIHCLKQKSCQDLVIYRRKLLEVSHQWQVWTTVTGQYDAVAGTWRYRRWDEKGDSTKMSIFYCRNFLQNSDHMTTSQIVKVNCSCHNHQLDSKDLRMSRSFPLAESVTQGSKFHMTRVQESSISTYII